MAEPSESSSPAVSLRRWVLLAIAPGLACDALSVLALAAQYADLEALQLTIMIALLAAPLIGLIYLIVLGRRFVAAGMGSSVLGFVVRYGLVNTFLWGAGCALNLGAINLH